MFHHLMKDEAFFNIKYKACKQLIWSYCCQFDSQLQYYYLKHFSSVSTCIHLYSPVSTCIHLYSPVLLTCILFTCITGIEIPGESGQRGAAVDKRR